MRTKMPKLTLEEAHRRINQIDDYVKANGGTKTEAYKQFYVSDKAGVRSLHRARVFLKEYGSEGALQAVIKRKYTTKPKMVTLPVGEKNDAETIFYRMLFKYSTTEQIVNILRNL